MSDGATVSGYHVAPLGRRRGGLVLIQEIFGITDHIKEQCEIYAAQGYEVLAPAIFDRVAPGLQLSYSARDIEHAIELVRAHPLSLAVSDAQSCIGKLKGDGPVFMTGYCYGGSVAWATACQSKDLAAASCYYGGMIPRLVDRSPNCPVILHFGESDPEIPLGEIGPALDRLGGVEVFVYPAGHGFNSDRRADYHHDSAVLARRRTLELFERSAA